MVSFTLFITRQSVPLFKVQCLIIACLTIVKHAFFFICNSFEKSTNWTICFYIKIPKIILGSREEDQANSERLAIHWKFFKRLSRSHEKFKWNKKPNLFWNKCHQRNNEAFLLQKSLGRHLRRITRTETKLILNSFTLPKKRVIVRNVTYTPLPRHILK